MKYQFFIVVIVLQSVFCGAMAAEESAADKEEAALLEKLMTDNKLDSINGKVVLEAVEEGKEPPLVVGTLMTKTETIKIQLLRKDQYKDLLKFNNQTVSMRGYVTDKSNQGKTIYFEEIEIAAPKAPGRTKRGGF